MLAIPSSADETGKDDQLEVKYDGFRALSGLSEGRVALVSRTGLDLSVRFPAVTAALAEVTHGEAVLDGEIIAGPHGGGRFQDLQAGGAARYVAFDLLLLGAEDLRARPLSERRARLERLLAGAPPVLTVAETVAGPLSAALARARAEGWEGLLAKDPGSSYQGRRSSAWRKIKLVRAQELAVVGYTPASYSAEAIGALLLAVRERGRFAFAGRVGTGYTEQMRRDLCRRLEADRVETPPVEDAPRLPGARWVRPRLVAQVAFTEWTADGKLRHPSFLGLREDKRPEDAVREPVFP